MEIFHPKPDTSLDAMTPQEIVERLGEYIIGQEEAKRAVAVAIRNRWRRRQLPPEMRKEVLPKNILMVGPTGVGKTEIARRLAELIQAPFIKVEASKYTEVGYHGRDVESMIRDLVKVAVGQVQARAMRQVEDSAKRLAEDRVLDMLFPIGSDESEDHESIRRTEERRERTREKLRAKLHCGEFDDRMIEISAPALPPIAGVFGTIGGEDIGLEMQEMLSKILPGRRKNRRVKVKEALRLFAQEEAEKLIDEESIHREGIELAEQNGIIFLDEIDKIIGSGRSDGPDVSREGVQRDLLPIVEGSTVHTKYGIVHTDHILFIAAGAFHGKKPSDLIPELQGRFPIRVELKPLTKADYLRILTHPKNALTKQMELLLATESVRVVFTPEGIELMAEIAEYVNRTTQDIGARRLHTVIEKVFEDISFRAPELRGQTIEITPSLIREKVAAIAKDEDLSRFVL